MVPSSPRSHFSRHPFAAPHLLAEEAEEARRHLCRIFGGGLSSNGAVTTYLQAVGGKHEDFLSCVACVCVRGLWSNCCHSITLPLISACEVHLRAKSVTRLRAVKCTGLCWHMDVECNGCQTSRGWADANQETGRTRARTIRITINLIQKVHGYFGSQLWVSQYKLIEHKMVWSKWHCDGYIKGKTNRFMSLIVFLHC